MDRYFHRFSVIGDRPTCSVEGILKSIKSIDRQDRQIFNKFWLLDLVPECTEEHVALYQQKISDGLPRKERLHPLPDGTSIILGYKNLRDPADQKRKQGFWFSSWYMGRNLEEATSNVKQKVKTIEIYPFRTRLVHSKGFDLVDQEWWIGYWKPDRKFCGWDEEEAEEYCMDEDIEPQMVIRDYLTIQQ